MATALFTVSPPPPPAHSNLFSSVSHKPASPLSAPRPSPRRFTPSLRTEFPFPANSLPSSVNGASTTSWGDGDQSSGDVSMSIDVLKRFIDLNLGSWKGSFHVVIYSFLPMDRAACITFTDNRLLITSVAVSCQQFADCFHQFDCDGNLLYKVSTKLGASSYGEDELMSLIQSLYIRQPPLSPEDEPEWFEYKIKETNMFTVDKYQQIGFFPKEKAFALRYQTAGMLETVLRQGVLGEDDIGEESPRNLKLPSRRPSLVCENCLYSLEMNARRIRAFHIMDPKGVLDMLLVFLEERGSGVVPHPSFENYEDVDRITPHLGTWKGHSVTKRSGVYGATLAEAETIAVLEISKDGQLIQDIRSTPDGSDVTTSVLWTGSISSNVVAFDGGFQLTLLPGGLYMGCPSDVAKSVQESKPFHLELCWLESPDKRQRLVRTYDNEGLAVSSTYILETRQ